MIFHRSLHSLFTAIATAALLAACGATPNTHDETAGWSAQKIYAEAREEMRGGGWDKAIKLLETLEAKYPFGRYAQQAQIDVAYSHWKNNDLASALAACDRFIKLYPNHDTIDYVYYLRGLINFNEDLGLLGKVSRQDPTERDNRGARESFDTFKELLTRFPDSKYADDARLRLKYLKNALAQYEVHVARYYMTRGAYVAPSTARKPWSPPTMARRRSKRRCTSWAQPTTRWASMTCATMPARYSTAIIRTA